MAILLESSTRRKKEWLVEYSMGPNHTNKRVTYLTGTAYKSGDILGKVTASGKFTRWDADAATGIETVAGICWDDVDATGGDVIGDVFYRGPAVVNQDYLYYNGDTEATANTGLLALDIVVKDGQLV
jgi:hypothetical protein